MFNDSVGCHQCTSYPIVCEDLPILRWHFDSLENRSYLDKNCFDYDARLARLPHIYVLTLGILQSIPNDLYEAAYIDGANGWQNSRSITFPMIMAVVAPTLISQYTFQL